jgi:hypothetical protein
MLKSCRPPAGGSASLAYPEQNFFNLLSGLGILKQVQEDLTTAKSSFWEILIAFIVHV